MEAKVDKETFLKQWAGQKLEAIRAACAEQGHKLQARSKEDALEEAWQVYSGVLTDAPSDAPPAEAVPAVEYDGRCIGERVQFRRAGFTFSRTWEALSPTPTAEQLERLQAEPAVQLRVRG